VAELRQDLLQQHRQGAELRRQRPWRLVRDKLGLRGDELIGLHLAFQDAKALIPHHGDTQHAVGTLVPVADVRQCTHVVSKSRFADLLALGDETDAETPAILHHPADHVQVTRLEHAQRQWPARKQDGVQREKRDSNYGIHGMKP